MASDPGCWARIGRRVVNLEHTFSVPIDLPGAFRFLEDIEKVSQCMPGATVNSIDQDGSFIGQIVVRLGPMEVSYRGRARWIELDQDRRVAVLEARGRELRGNGTANANVKVEFTPQDCGVTEVRVSTELRITGRPAQFGRGAMQDVGNRLLSQFADCLKAEISTNMGETKGESV